MRKIPLDIYDEMPPGMRAYISNYGWHFNRKAFEEAVKGMRKRNVQTGRLEPIEAWDKEKVTQVLEQFGVKVENDVMYDAAYQANWCVAYLYKSSVPDDVHLALFVKNTLDDADGCDGLPFRCWLQRRVAMGEPVAWEDLI